MGIYLSQPNTVKESSDIDSQKFICGCSSMQGWRSSQEDAHNMIPNFDKDTTIFAVYDGHGGSEVAKYTAIHFPEYIKKFNSQNLSMENFLQQVFLSFDMTLKDPSNYKELQKLSGQSDDDSAEDIENQSNQSSNSKENGLQVGGDALSSKLIKSKKLKTILFSPHLLSKKRNRLIHGCNDDDDNVIDKTKNEVLDHSPTLDDNHPRGSQMDKSDISFKEETNCQNTGPSTSSGINDSSFFANESFINPKEAEALHKEAQIPIEVLAEKYGSETDDKPVEFPNAPSCSATSNTDLLTCKSLLSEKTRNMLILEEDKCMITNELEASDSDDEDDEDFELSSMDEERDEGETSSEADDDDLSTSNISVNMSIDKKPACDDELESLNSKNNKSENQQIIIKDDNKRKITTDNDSSKSNGHLVDLDKISQSSDHISSPIKKLKVEESEIIPYKNTDIKINGHVESEDGQGNSTTDMENHLDGEGKDVVKGETDEIGDDKESEEEEEEDEEDDENDEDESLNFDDPEQAKKILSRFSEGTIEKPAFDSGCTAVVAMLKGSTLFVANVGDSRCIVGMEGVAHDMSIDHKPEDKIERDRIEKAGGYVTEDGRVNEGLNLSRALGDHSYKTVADLEAEEQMISAKPDVTELKLTNKHNFIVIACDGIWNSMTSQDVVNFVEERRAKYADKPSKICEELFDHCLAPDTSGDGTGCDNMTCIIVLLKEGAFQES